jgi:hypothetical protein
VPASPLPGPAPASANPEGFVPLSLEADKSSGSEIHIQIRAGENRVSVHWPISAAAECAAWLRMLLP